MNVANDNLAALKYPSAPIPTYKAQDFEKMIKETKPDEVIITTMERTHDIYIIKALELGCNVITEKPMTIDEVRCKAIIDVVERTGKKVRVTFNYRYAPHNTKVFELLGTFFTLISQLPRDMQRTPFHLHSTRKIRLANVL
jgi:predicted dehydrogenase